MNARSTTVRGDPEQVDAGIEYVRDQVMPAVREMDGFVGLSMLADRSSGTCIVTSAWLDLDAMRASRERAWPYRDRSREVFAGVIAVHEWEIALLHRVRPADAGACCRVVWTQAQPALMTPLLDLFRTTVVPAAEQLPGFCSLSLMRDPRAGTSVTATTFESREALDASREAAAAMGPETV
jgi:heme-degrading monooxygenase HmoA